MTQVAEGKIAVVTDAEAIQEILYRYGAIHHWETGVAIVNSLLQLVPEACPIDLEDMRRAIDLFQEYAPKGLTA